MGSILLAVVGPSTDGNPSGVLLDQRNGNFVFKICGRSAAVSICFELYM